MLEAYDLPDLAAAIAPRPLLLLDAVDGAGEPLREVSPASDAARDEALRAWLSGG